MNLVGKGQRPELPAGAPAEFVKLIGDCWAQDPATRPTMANVVDRLHSMLIPDSLATPVAASKSPGTTLSSMILTCLLASGVGHYGISHQDES